MIDPALALVELPSVALGIRVADAMVKRAAYQTVRAGTVQPGRYLVLVGGTVAEVEEGVEAAREIAAGRELDLLFLPAVDRAVVHALLGTRRSEENGEALGVVETRTVAATLAAADAAVKGAQVELLEVHLADGLGGNGYLLLSGEVSDVEAAVEIGVGFPGVSSQLIEASVIAQLHPELRAELRAGARFGERIRSLTE